jgi:hypothetical protein
MFCNPASGTREECECEEGAPSEEGSDKGGGLVVYELDGVMGEGVDVDMIFSIERESGLESESKSASIGEETKSSW